MKRIKVRDKLKEIYCPGELVIVDFLNIGMIDRPIRIAKIDTTFNTSPDEFYEALCKSVKEYTEDILFPMNYEAFMETLILNKPNMITLREDRPHACQYVHITVWSYANDMKSLKGGKFKHGYDHTW